MSPWGSEAIKYRVFYRDASPVAIGFDNFSDLVIVMLLSWTGKLGHFA